MQNNIQAIIFDYGEVIELSGIKLVSGIVDILGVKKDDWRNVYYKYNHLTNIENKDWKEVGLLVAGELGATTEQLDKIADLVDESRRKKKLNTDLLELIKRLKLLGFKTAVISNYTSILREKIIKQNINHLFDEIIISSEEGYQKPDKRLFGIAFKRLGVEAKNAVFIDDAPKSLILASDIGYVPILYKDNETLKSSLSQILGIEL